MEITDGKDKGDDLSSRSYQLVHLRRPLSPACRVYGAEERAIVDEVVRRLRRVREEVVLLEVRKNVCHHRVGWKEKRV